MPKRKAPGDVCAMLVGELESLRDAVVTNSHAISKLEAEILRICRSLKDTTGMPSSDQLETTSSDSAGDTETETDNDWQSSSDSDADSHEDTKQQPYGSDEEESDLDSDSEENDFGANDSRDWEFPNALRTLQSFDGVLEAAEAAGAWQHRMAAAGCLVEVGDYILLRPTAISPFIAASHRLQSRDAIIVGEVFKLRVSSSETSFVVASGIDCHDEDIFVRTQEMVAMSDLDRCIRPAGSPKSNRAFVFTTSEYNADFSSSVCLTAASCPTFVRHRVLFCDEDGRVEQSLVDAPAVGWIGDLCSDKTIVVHPRTRSRSLCQHPVPNPETRRAVEARILELLARCTDTVVFKNKPLGQSECDSGAQQQQCILGWIPLHLRDHCIAVGSHLQHAYPTMHNLIKLHISTAICGAFKDRAGAARWLRLKNEAVADAIRRAKDGTCINNVDLSQCTHVELDADALLSAID